MRRRRIGLLAATSWVTVFVAMGSLGILSRVAIPTDSVDVASAAAISTARIDPVVVPPEENLVEQQTVEERTVEERTAEENGAEVALAKSAKPVVGKRIVFSLAAQRVWLVNADESVSRTYVASGSISDNLRAGSYKVQSKSRNATSYDYGSTMQYFVRFTTGRNAPIGFHDIPVDNDGSLVQTLGQLGTPLSAGCIRQARPDAVELWNFAPVGTPVEVLD